MERGGGGGGRDPQGGPNHKASPPRGGGANPWGGDEIPATPAFGFKLSSNLKERKSTEHPYAASIREVYMKNSTSQAPKKHSFGYFYIARDIKGIFCSCLLAYSVKKALSRLCTCASSDDSHCFIANRNKRTTP